MYMLAEFHTMWDGYFSRTNIAKQRIKRLHEKVQPVHLAPCRAGPNNRKFEIPEIEKIIEQNVIEPGQNEFAAPSSSHQKRLKAAVLC